MVIAFAGCSKPNAAPAPEPVEGSEAKPTDFFNFCCGDVISVGFPLKYLEAGPGGSSTAFNLSSSSGGTAKVEHLVTRRSTALEADQMMRKLYTELRRIAQEKGCEVDGLAELSGDTSTKSFKLIYSRKNNRGEVETTRIDKDDKDKAEASKVYSVKITVLEVVGKPQ